MLEINHLDDVIEDLLDCPDITKIKKKLVALRRKLTNFSHDFQELTSQNGHLKQENGLILPYLADDFD